MCLTTIMFPIYFIDRESIDKFWSLVWRDQHIFVWGYKEILSPKNPSRKIDKDF